LRSAIVFGERSLGVGDLLLQSAVEGFGRHGRAACNARDDDRASDDDCDAHGERLRSLTS
jgi:hypothetical protein